MHTITGIGTIFYGISKPNDKGIINATYWFVFLYFPIIPLWRAELVREVTKPRIFNYQLISKQRLRIKEVIRTYFFGWIITPLIWFGPAILIIPEIAVYIGLSPTDKGGFGLYEGLLVFSIIYFIVFVWKWKNWIEKQGLPENYKDILKDKQQSITKNKPH
jgi:hypothetical protein